MGRGLTMLSSRFVGVFTSSERLVLGGDRDP